MNDELIWLPLATLADMLRHRRLSPVELVDAYLARIEHLNPALNAFVLINADAAHRAAREAEARLQHGDELPPLYGLPVSVKDTLPTAGLRTTFGTTLFRDFVPGESTAVVEKLERQGCIILGKTNTPTFGWIATTHNPLFGATRNPWNTNLTPGGSSGGAAVAAIAGLAAINIGTDGGGSLRIPAAFTGTVGFKATHGRVANYPSGANWSLQHAGAITRTVEDAAFALNAIAGPDPRDPYCLPGDDTDYVAALTQRPRHLKLLYTESFGFGAALEPACRDLCRAAAADFGRCGWTVIDRKLDWPSPKNAWMTLFTSALARRVQDFHDRVGELDSGLRALVDHFRRLPDGAYFSAWLHRGEWWKYPQVVFDEVDLLVTPTTSCPPFPIGLEGPARIENDPASFYDWMSYTYPFNLTGHPAVSVPAGMTPAGLPVGLQIVGPRFADALVLQAAAALQEVRPWPTCWPGRAGPTSQ